MELTREAIEGLANGTIKPCDMCDSMSVSPFRMLAKQFIVEIDKPKGTMVTTEKEQNIKCGHFLRDAVCEKYGGFTEKNRELVDLAWKACLSVNGIVVIPAKSPEREIAEKYSKISLDGKACMTGNGTLYIDGLTDIIESAINEYKESVK